MKSYIVSYGYIDVMFLSSDPSVRTESRKRKRKSDDGDQDDDSGDSAVRCPVKKHECHLYDLYRSKWWVFIFSLKKMAT